ALVRALARRFGSAGPVATGIAGAILLAVNFRTQMRPETVALILFATLLLLLDRLAAAPAAAMPGAAAPRGESAAATVAAIAAVGLVWANSHGSFVLAPALPLVFLAGAAGPDGRVRARRLGIAAAVLVLVSCVNPYGPRLWFKALDLASA